MSREPVTPTIPRTAMVLAAGLGTRMRPLTDDWPKPLIEEDGKALIDHVLDELARSGVERAVVNCHYKADKLEAHLTARTTGPAVTLSDEREGLLDSGGGVKKALPLLGEGPFLVVNGDCLWRDGPVRAVDRLAAAWDPERMDALLLMVPLNAIFVGLKWELSIELVFVIILLSVMYVLLHRLEIPHSWPAIVMMMAAC